MSPKPQLLAIGKMQIKGPLIVILLHRAVQWKPSCIPFKLYKKKMDVLSISSLAQL